jgi:hypothetical protein
VFIFPISFEPQQRSINMGLVTQTKLFYDKAWEMRYFLKPHVCVKNKHPLRD